MALRDLVSDLSQGAGTPFVSTPMIDRGAHTHPAALSPPLPKSGTDVTGKPLTFPRTGTTVTSGPMTFPRTGTSVLGGPQTFTRTGTNTSPFITGPITGIPILYTTWTGPFNTTTSFLLGHGSNLFSNSPPVFSASNMYTPKNLKISNRKGFSWVYSDTYMLNQFYQQDGFSPTLTGSNTFNFLKIHGENLLSKYTGPVAKYSVNALTPQNIENSDRKGFNPAYSINTYVGDQYYGMDGFNSALTAQPTFNFLKIHGENLKEKYTGPVPSYSIVGFKDPDVNSLKESKRKGFKLPSYDTSTYIGNQYYGEDGFSQAIKDSDTWAFLRTKGQNLKKKYEVSPSKYSNTGFKNINFTGGTVTKLRAATTTKMINYKTNSYYGQALKYGLDVSGGGDSGRPYIVREIGKTWYGGDAPPTCHVANSLIRGGMRTAVSRTAADVKRTSKYMFSPCGLLWMTMQFGLQLTNPKTESTTLQGTRIFNPLSILANTAGAAFGVHVQRHGIPIISQTYEQIVRAKVNTGVWKMGSKVPKLGVMGPGLTIVKLGKEFDKFDIEYKKVEQWEEPKTKKGLGKLGAGLKKGIGKLGNLLGKLFGDGSIGTLSSPLAGPHSVYGIGSTWIKRSTIFSDALTAGEKGGIRKIEKDRIGLGDYWFPPSYGNAAQSLALASSDAPGQGWTGIDGFMGSGVSTITPKKEQTVNIINADDCKLYNTLTYEQLQKQKSRIASDGNSADGTSQQKGVQGLLKKKYMGPAAEKGGANARALGKSGEDKKDNFYDRKIYGTYEQSAPGKSATDIDPINKSSTGTGSDFVTLKLGDTQFLCYISSLSDKVAPDWTAVEYVGRPDKAYVYKGISRDISFNFTVAALTKKELAVIWGKCQKLAQSVSPELSDSASDKIISGQLTTLQIGNYFGGKGVKVNGYISSLSYSIDDSYIWDIDSEMPMYVKVDITFQVIWKDNPPSNKWTYFGPSQITGNDSPKQPAPK